MDIQNAELTKEEAIILNVFEAGFQIKEGCKYLIENGFTIRELESTITKLKKEKYLDEVNTPVGAMYCTLIHPVKLEQLREKFGIKNPDNIIRWDL